jgi:hypothetical protein
MKKIIICKAWCYDKVTKELGVDETSFEDFSFDANEVSSLRVDVEDRVAIYFKNGHVVVVDVDFNSMFSQLWGTEMVVEFEEPDGKIPLN